MGVLEVSGKPTCSGISGRRYLCKSCGCVMLVVPRELSPWRRYTLVTIALALADFGAGVSTAALRARLSANHTVDPGWPSVRRWLRAIAAGKLFRWIRGVSELSGRALAERVSAVVAEASGFDSRSMSFEARIIAGVMASSES